MGIKTPKPVVFFGTGPVAAKSLELLARHSPIEAIITKPKPAHHKGSFPVLDTAKRLGIPTLLVTNRAELDTLLAQQKFESQLGILIDFGIIVSKQAIDFFPLGILNSHFSILPELRGADPITFAILSGQKSTGVSLMFLVEAMDEGALAAYKELAIEPDETTHSLTEKLIALSNELLMAEIPLIQQGKQSLISQNDTGRSVSYTRRLTKQDGVIDWHKSAVELEREIRAYLGWPGSQTTLGGVPVHVLAATVSPEKGQPGTVSIQNKKLLLHTEDRSLQITMLKPAGKNAMSSESFIAGYQSRLS